MAKLQLTGSRKPSSVSGTHQSIIAAGGGRMKTILRTKSAPLHVIYEGKNVTPKPLDPVVYQMAKERQIGVYDDRSTLSGKENSTLIFTNPDKFETPSIRFKTEVGEGGTSVFRAASLDVFEPEIPSFCETDLSTSARSSVVEGVLSSDSMSYPKMKMTPSHVTLVLSETNTFFVLDIPSCLVLKDTEEGDRVERSNAEYEYLTEGKGRNRKVVNVEVQTVYILRKSRATEAEAAGIHNKRILTSTWEMYDTYNEQENVGELQEDSSSDSDDSEFKTGLMLDTTSIRSQDSYFKLSPDEKQINKLMKNVRFQEALCVIERLLANNCYNEEQKRFRGLLDPDMCREDINYNYKLHLLWTFANNTTKGRCVSALQWNPSNQDLLAVGYGKFYFTDTVASGMIMIWNIKNPVQPERTYNFEDPVTTLCFSTKDPNLLAVGFYNGRVLVLNISSREVSIIGQNELSFDAVWSVVWRPNLDPSKDTEQICASSDDGKVIFYTLEGTMALQGQEMMRVTKSDGKLKGYSSSRKCSSLSIPVSRYAGVRLIRWHPVNPDIYLVCTKDGVVHKCSTNYLNQHLDLFMAHDGAINDLKFSPFTNKIYATCGDDWHLRLWAEGIAEPLHELYVTMAAVQSMDWSPTHSTILATTYGQTILLWDFQRKVWKPQSETTSPTGSRNTIVQFTASGRCLVVGDLDGNVHVFALDDMPFPAFFQANLLYESLITSMITKPTTMEKLKKLRWEILKTN